MKPAQALYELQIIELALLRAQKRLGEIDALLNDSAAVSQARAARDHAAEQLKPLRAQARAFELEIRATQDKSQQTETMLYSGSVTNPKTLQDMQHEIEALKRRRAEQEDQLLEVMVTVDDAETALKNAEAALEDALREALTQHGNLIHERDELTAKAATLTAQRETALTRVDAASLKMYNAIKPRRANQPVSLMDGLTCSACGVEQTTMLVAEARNSDKLVTCSSCGRILYVKA